MSGSSNLQADVSHIYGSDMGETATGDIALATGATRTIQRVIRRLLTPATTVDESSYPWEPAYGAGLGERVGEAINVLEVQGVILAQMQAEDSVASSPAPTVSIDASLSASGEYTVRVKYYDLTGTLKNFNFDIAA